MDDAEEIVREFLVESYENLDQLDRDLVALESEPGARPLLASIFRTVHTIKGTSGFLGFGRLEKVTHVGESLLVELRDGVRTMDQATTDVLLALTDVVRAILGHVESAGTDGEVDVDTVIAQIEAIRNPAAGPAATAAPAAVAEPVAVGAAAPRPVRRRIGGTKPPVAPAAVAPAAPAHDGTAVPEQRHAPAETPVAEPAPASPASVVEPSADAAAADIAPAPAVAVRPTPVPAAPTAEPVAGEQVARSASDTSIRVDVEVLDLLMRQVGELVLARNQIFRIAGDGEDVELARAAQRLNLIAGELQEGVMKTRMQPIEHVWSKMPRVVRDLAAACGREVALEMVGKDTELDRTLLEAVKDPLTHLVRNAVDHGIEAPADRVALGKPAKGVLTLRAYHAGGQVVVEVADDGRGIAPEMVGAAAVAKGLRTQAQVDAATPAELLALLFLPGFSTAAKVTKVSGRGVGMDVVKTKIEEIGGTVEVESVVGHGTVWRLRIPLTLAIMPTLTIACGGDVYAVPQVNLVELVALDNENAGRGIEHVHAAPVYRLRGELLPLISLAGVLGVEQQEPSVIAVLAADGRRFGILVDQVVNTEEIVVKPLSPRLKSIGLYAGATVLGDGRVALILDVQAIARNGLSAEQSSAADAAAAEAAERAAGESDQVLLVGLGGDRRVAMPLASVARLEHFAADQVEVVGGRQVVQYRGGIMPLLDLSATLGAYGRREAEELQVVVFSHGRRSVGISVDAILDVVDDDGSGHSDVDDSGLIGSAVLEGRITELLDVERAILTADPSFYDDDPTPAVGDLVGALR